MAAGESHLFAQLPTMEVATATLQSQVAGMHSRTPATPTTSYARTPALRGKTDLLTMERLMIKTSMKTAGVPYYPGTIALTSWPSGLCHSSTP